MKKPTRKYWEEVKVIYTPYGGKIVIPKMDWKGYAEALEKYIKTKKL